MNNLQCRNGPSLDFLRARARPKIVSNVIRELPSVPPRPQAQLAHLVQPAQAPVCATAKFERTGSDPALFRKYRSETDPAKKRTLLDQLIAANMGLVRMYVSRIHLRSRIPTELEDLEQAGRMGLEHAFQTLDPDKGVLSSWANWWITDEVQKSIRAQGSSFSRSHRNGMPYSMRRKADVIYAKTGQEATAAELGCTDAQLQAWNTPHSFVSLDAHPKENGDDYDASYSFQDLLSYEDVSIEDQVAESERRAQLRRAFAKLPERERHMADALFLQEHSQEELAQLLGLTGICKRGIDQRIQHIRKRLFEKIKRLFVVDTK